MSSFPCGFAPIFLQYKEHKAVSQYPLMNRLLLLLLILLLTACASAHSPASTPPSLPCAEPGVIERIDLEGTARGYPYSIRVYTPPCYAQQPERAYPLLVLVPGRGSGPTTWFAAGLAEALNEQILSGAVPPFLVVTTENINDDPQAEIITQAVVPYIETHYRVSPERRHHAVAGGSLGGIAAYRIAFSNPADWASAGIFGAGAISGEEAVIRAWLKDLPNDLPLRVFLNTGEGDPLMLERAEVMLTLLDEAGVPHQEIFTDGDHAYSYWLSNFPAYLRWLSGDW
jgi:enterochelin esterase-like enzyme